MHAVHEMLEEVSPETEAAFNYETFQSQLHTHRTHYVYS